MTSCSCVPSFDTVNVLPQDSQKFGSDSDFFPQYRQYIVSKRQQVSNKGSIPSTHSTQKLPSPKMTHCIEDAPSKCLHFHIADHSQTVISWLAAKQLITAAYIFMKSRAFLRLHPLNKLWIDSGSVQSETRSVVPTFTITWNVLVFCEMRKCFLKRHCVLLNVALFLAFRVTVVNKPTNLFDFISQLFRWEIKYDWLTGGETNRHQLLELYVECKA